MKNKLFLKRILVLFFIAILGISTTSAASSKTSINDACVVIHAGEYPRQSG